MMTIMSHQPARAGSPARLGQLTHPLTSSWDLWSPRLTRILQDFAVFFIMSGLFEGNRKVNQNTTWFAEGSFVYLPVCASLRREQENMGTCPLLHLARVFCHPSFHWLPTIQPTTTHPPYYQPTCLPVVFLQSSVFGLSVCPPPFLRHSSRHILTQTYSVKD